MCLPIYAEQIVNGSRIEVKLAKPPKREADESPHRSRHGSTSTEASAATWSTNVNAHTLTPSSIASALSSTTRSLFGAGGDTPQAGAQSFTRVMERGIMQTGTSYTVPNYLSLPSLPAASGQLTLSALMSELSASPAGPSAIAPLSLVPQTNGPPVAGELALGSLPLMQALQIRGAMQMNSATALQQQQQQSMKSMVYERLPPKGLGLSAIAVNGATAVPKNGGMANSNGYSQTKLPKLQAPCALTDSNPAPPATPQAPVAAGILGHLKNLSKEEAAQLLNALLPFVAARTIQTQAPVADPFPLGSRSSLASPKAMNGGPVGQYLRNDVIESLFPGR